MPRRDWSERVPISTSSLPPRYLSPFMATSWGGGADSDTGPPSTLPMEAVRQRDAVSALPTSRGLRASSPRRLQGRHGVFAGRSTYRRSYVRGACPCRCGSQASGAGRRAARSRCRVRHPCWLLGVGYSHPECACEDREPTALVQPCRSIQDAHPTRSTSFGRRINGHRHKPKGVR